MKALPIALAVLFLSACGAAAQAADCDNAQTQLALNDCANAGFKSSDAALNKVYKSLSASVSPEGAKALKTAQRAWITWRDAQCTFETLGTTGGSIHPMVYSLCLDSLTQAQTARLEAQANCEEGDMSCGGQ